MEQESIRPSEDQLMEQEEKCRKAMKTVGKAIVMRLFVTALLIWVLLQTGMALWIIGLMVFVMIINLTGLLPLVQELRKRLHQLREILDQYE